MALFPLDPVLMMVLKFFVVLTCFFYWIRMLMRRAVRSQQPHYWHERER